MLNKPKIACVQALAALTTVPFLSKEETRYYLNGFNIRPDSQAGGVQLAATDGHKMLCIHDVHGTADAEMIVKVDTRLLKLKPAVPNVRNWLVARLWPDGSSRADLVTAGNAKDAIDLTERSSAMILGTQHMVVIDGKFPDYDRVSPKIGRSGKIGNPGFVSFNVLKAFDLPTTVDFDGWFEPATRKSHSFMLRFGHDETAGPQALATGPGEVDLGSSMGRYVYGVIMPIRSEASELPSFVSRVFSAIAKNVVQLVAGGDAVEGEIQKAGETATVAPLKTEPAAAAQRQPSRRETARRRAPSADPRPVDKVAAAAAVVADLDEPKTSVVAAAAAALEERKAA